MDPLVKGSSTEQCHPCHNDQRLPHRYLRLCLKLNPPKGEPSNKIQVNMSTIKHILLPSHHEGLYIPPPHPNHKYNNPSCVLTGAQSKNFSRPHKPIYTNMGIISHLSTRDSQSSPSSEWPCFHSFLHPNKRIKSANTHPPQKKMKNPHPKKKLQED
jgi:hypothetical protein